jgi:hypothetical protein
MLAAAGALALAHRDTNLVERQCGSCGLTMVLTGTGHCKF